MDSWRDLPLVLVDGPTSWTDLPTVLKTDILARLPVKTLVISTAVSKSWYTHIKTPTFISTHINRSTPITQSLIFAPTSSTTFTLLTNNQKTKLHPPFTPRSESVVISGSSCDGLLLLVESSPEFWGRYLYLWNPSLHKHKPVGGSTLVGINDPENTYPLLGFGFSKTHNDYMIVRILYSIDKRSCSFDIKVAPGVEVYSLRKDCWRKVDAKVTRMARHGRWVCIDGVIYWLEMKHQMCNNWLCWFDLNREVFGEMELPGKFWDGMGQHVQALVCEYKGLLGFCVSENSCDTIRVSLWVKMDDWVNQLRIVLKDTIGWPVKFTKSGDLILKASEDTMLVEYDLEKHHYKEIENDGPYSVDTSFGESLLLFEERKPRFRASLFQ